MEKTEVTISRHWDNPQIRTEVTGEGISISISINDFMNALKEELNINGIKEQLKNQIGSVTFVMTKEEIAKRIYLAMDIINLSNMLDKAAVTVIKKVKEESAKVV